MLYEMLAGRPVFAQTSTALLLHTMLNQPPTRIETIDPGADPALARIALRLLQEAGLSQ